jgi:transposase
MGDDAKTENNSPQRSRRTQRDQNFESFQPCRLQAGLLSRSALSAISAVNLHPILSVENFRIAGHAPTRGAMKRYLVNLTDDERAELQRITTKGRMLAVKAARARILLKADEGLTDAEIVEHLDVGVATVERVRKRFVLEGMKAALEQRPQTNPRAMKLDGEGEARLVQLACSEPPSGRRRWTLHLLAETLVELKVVDSISHEAVRQRLEKKRAPALAGSTLVHSGRKERRVRSRDGGRAGSLPTSVRSKATSDLLG